MNVKYNFGRIKNSGEETLSFTEIVKYWQEDLAGQGIYVNPFILKRMQRADMLMPVYVSFLHPDRKKVKPRAGRDAPRAKITLKTLCGLWYLLLRVAYDPGFFCLLQDYAKACLVGLPYCDSWKIKPVCRDIRKLNHVGRIALRELNLRFNGYREVIQVLNEKTDVISRAKEAAELDRAVSNLQWKLLYLTEKLPALAHDNDRVTARELLSSIDEVIPSDVPDEAGNTDTVDKSGEELGIQQAAARLVTALELDADSVEVARYLKKNLLRPELKRMKLELRQKERADEKAHTEELKRIEEQYEQDIKKLEKELAKKDRRIKELNLRIATNSDPARGSTKKDLPDK